jgi:ketosteroid isomerase-like protein
VASGNVEIVTGLFENALDRAAVDLLAEDVSLVIHGLWSGDPAVEETVAGKAAVGAWYGDWFRQFDRDYRFEIEESRQSGARVFIVATHHGRGRASGAPITGRIAYVFNVRGRKIARVEMWVDREAALSAFGG